MHDCGRFTSGVQPTTPEVPSGAADNRGQIA